MEKFIRNILSIGVLSSIVLTVWVSNASYNRSYYFRNNNFVMPPDTTPKDTNINLHYPFDDNEDNTPKSGKSKNPLYLNNPKNISTEVEYDSKTKEYIIKSKVGNYEYRRPSYMGFDDYMNYDVDNSLKEYWKQRAEAQNAGEQKGSLAKIHIGGELFDRIFGGSSIDIRPQGSAELIFGVKSSKRDDPALDVKQRRTTNFDFQEKIQMNVTAKIGDKIQLGVNYNTESNFDFENKMKLAYEGKEDEIIKLIEAGNVSMPLNSTLITGSQSLFGFKTKLQFGKVFVTGIFSEQQSKAETINVSGGAQVSNFSFKADQYEENKHFFISQYFRNHYEQALAKLPLITSSITITKIEVWATTVGAATTENRNILAFSDLGEEKDTIKIKQEGKYRKLKLLNNTNQWVKLTQNDKIHRYYLAPNNYANNIYKEVYDKFGSVKRDINSISALLQANFTGTSKPLIQGQDYEKVENARKLNQNEYTFNSKLGFISLNNTLNSDQVLAVAFQYKRVGDTTTYQVGEFSNQGIAAPQTLIVKLLKPVSVNTHTPIWNIMMKNIYSMGAYQVNKEDFRFNILYTNDTLGVPVAYLDDIREKNGKPKPLIKVFGLDKLNTQLDTISDGVFDFIDGAAANGGTIQASNGRIYFPSIEPFGRTIRNAIDPDGSKKSLADKYAYDSLYTMTKTGAQQYPDKNKFTLSGKYKSAGGSDISLNAMNVPQGSVKVTAGGVPLSENVDYTVDYALGRVKIINEGILNSGTPIQISLENNSLFSVQKKTLWGTRVDYAFNKDFNIGATMMHLSERPLTQKVNFGEEPISNTIWGLDANYQTESNYITKLLDKLPFYQTKTASKITLSGEFAQLIPGHSKAIGQTGTSYIDDFEGSTTEIDLKNVGNWFLASVPQGQDNDFPNAKLIGNLKSGFNRANIAWYTIDPLFLRNNNITPSHIKNDKNQQSSHFVREILETEVFPNKQPANGQPTALQVLNLSYYPKERGPYNYDVDGLNSDGKLKNPENSWGGIMRSMTTTDFEATNIEYIQFWMMDPFVYDNKREGGDFCINIGDVSEDVLRDSRKSFENGLPITATDTGAALKNVAYTAWGRVPTLQALVNSFDNDPNSRKYQDVGLDGLGNEDERSFFNSTYLQKIKAAYGESSQAYQNANNDPSGDDYHYFQGTDYDNEKTSILDRYRRYNDMEGNSPTSDQSKESYPTSATNLPNEEDINKDNTLNEDERYYQYTVKLAPNEMVVGQNYIADKLEATVKLKNGTTSTVNWYQFKIPIRDGVKFGNIQDFRSIRFMRMFFKGFKDSIHCRLATLDLIRTEWRKYNYDLLSPGEYVPTDNINETNFTISSVNIEENGTRTPIPYVLPPDIERQINLGTTTLTKMNEQSLSLKVCNLIDGDARAIYKTADLDVRKYKRFKMFVHGEKQKSNRNINDGDLKVFVRMGTDFTNNYYEYEIPLKLSNDGVTDANDIWPEVNSFDVAFDKFVEAKKARPAELPLSEAFVKNDGNNKITIVGLPNLAAVKTIMIGVRNPKKNSLSDTDDGQAKCAEIWFDEFRLTDFDEKGGYAAVGRVNIQLADLGNLVLAGNISTPGFGTLEQKINERQKANITQYDVATNLELGKFLPEKSGIKIPLHVDYSQNFTNPEYDPLDPDVKYKDALSKAENATDYKKERQDYTMRKNINFMNVKKVKTGTASQPHIYDIENLDLTYAYSETYHRDIDVEYNIEKKYKTALGYNFVNNPKKVSPFKKIKLFSKSKYFNLIKDFNFYYFPKMLTFRTDFDRQFTETMIRNNTIPSDLMEPTYTKLYNWNRLYGLKFDITQNLKVDYQAQATASIDEPKGIPVSSYTSKEKKQVRDSIFSFGRLTNFSQKLMVNYTVPINKIPLLDWLNVTTTYNGEYHWTASPISLRYLGNVIENGNTKQINGTANMVNLYNKIGYLKELNEKEKGANTKGGKKGGKEPKIGAKDSKKEKNDKGKAKKDKDNKKKSNKNNKKKSIDDEELDSLETKPINYLKLVVDNTLKLMMSVRNISLSYNQGDGTVLPGFTPIPQAFGMDWNKSSPGTDFVFGGQRDIRGDAVRNNWLTRDTTLNNMYITKSTKNLSYRVSLEPIPDLKLEISGNRSETHSVQSIFRADSTGEFHNYSSVENGSFSISYFIWPTAFKKENADYSSGTFNKFKQYTHDIAKMLAEQRYGAKYPINDSTGYPLGFGPTSQNVMIPAFLAAYTGKSPSKSMNIFPQIPKPNWRLTYTGLSKIEFLQDFFESITIGHAYQSSYNLGNYVSNVRYQEGMDVRDILRNNVPKYDINQITLTEQFSPLINLDMVLENSVMAKVEFKKSRNLSLSLANNQLTELKSNEMIFGLGYRIKDVVFYIKGLSGAGKKKKFQSDVNLKGDLSIRNNKTFLRKFTENSDQISTGQKVISINISVDYQLSEKVEIRLYFDDIINRPYVSSQYPNSNTNGGISMRFTLAQ